MSRFKFNPVTGQIARTRRWIGYLVLGAIPAPLFLTRDGTLTLDRSKAYEFEDQDRPMRLLRDQLRHVRGASAHVEEV